MATLMIPSFKIMAITVQKRAPIPSSHPPPNQPRPQILHRTVPLQRVAVPTKQLQILKMISPTLRPRNDVVHRQMLRQEMRPATIAVPALRAVKHNLRLAQRRRRLAIRALRNIRPRDSLNTTHQPELIPNPLLHQLQVVAQPQNGSVPCSSPLHPTRWQPHAHHPTTNTKSQKSPTKSHPSQFRQQPPSPQHPLPQQPSPLPRAISLPLPGGD